MTYMSLFTLNNVLIPIPLDEKFRENLAKNFFECACPIDKFAVWLNIDSLSSVDVIIRIESYKSGVNYR
ncbi:hypothetical protein HZS_7051 [Henneguya salminicola]|nr:hypothetical protein HZS_7051 [Henneguya salminicola]